ncbi:MAG: hypothetical protein KDE20_01070 [Caldilineaceae bacterium]|nr:hypothetical protein [Caldilineaceae bacterium]
MAKLLSKAAILAAQDLSTEVVEVPEWGGSVMVRAMTGRQRDVFESVIYKVKGKDVQLNIANVRAELVSRTVVDEGGTLLFSPEDVAALGDKSASALDRIYAVAQRLSGITKDDIAELTENFTDGQSGASTSD